MKPIFFKPVLQDKIWGGNKLKTEFNLEIPTNTVGEAWCISAHPNGISKVLSPKEYSGLGLDELYKNNQHLFGNENKNVFPLLIKILDAKEDLSVQVHPDDEYGLKYEGELGKTECWYVISADEGAKIIYGHTAKNKKEFESMMLSEKWNELLLEVPVKAGDFFDVPAGTVHAIGGGVVILETQQNSDTTYRLYDYNRIDSNGNKRELHLSKSADVVNYPSISQKQNILEEKYENGVVKRLLTNKYFNVYKVESTKEIDISLLGLYTLATVIKGSGFLEIGFEKYDLKLADSFILPNGINKIKIIGDIELIFSNPV